MSLDLLPAELQIEVLSYLDNSDLKAARAASRKLRDNASPALFRSVIACARYDALGAFQKVSLHSVLQKYVKQIVFDGSLYNKDLAYDQRGYELRNDQYEELRTSSFWGKRTRWKRYQDLYKEQEDLKASGVLLQTIARAMEWIMNVSSIVYSPHPHLIPIEAKVVRDLIPRDFRGGQTDLHHQSHNHLEHPFRQLIGAIYVSQYTGIRELRAEAYHENEIGNPFTFAFFDFPDSNDLQAAKHLFQNLERCELNIKVWSLHRDTTLWSFSDGGKQRLAHLSHLLAAAHNLQHLVLQITGWKPLQESTSAMTLHPEWAMFARLGLQKTWLKLRSLSLEGVFAHGDDFLDLIRRHRYTLASLKFRICSLFSGTWADIVDEVVYNTQLFRFSLNLVNEMQILAGHGTTHSSDEMEEWIYEGHLEVSKDGERRFVDSNSTNISVYH